MKQLVFREDSGQVPGTCSIYRRAVPSVGAWSREHGIRQPSRTLGQQFDRIAGFVEDNYAHLTPEQIAGNITNLQALLAQTNGDQDLAAHCSR